MMRISVRRAVSLALALLLAACAPLPTRPSAGPIADIPEDVTGASATSLSPAFSTRLVRVDVADRAWRVIAGNFYDPQLNGVNWNGDGIALLTGRQRHLGKHVQLEGTIAVLHDASNLRGSSRRVDHITHVSNLAREHAIGVGVDLDRDGTLARDLCEILFVHVRQHPYGGHVGDGEEFLVRLHNLTGRHIELGNHAGERGAERAV